MRRKIRFIPIQHGDIIEFDDLGIFGVSGSSKFLGFKPAHGIRRAGWLVIAESPSAHTRKKKL